MWRQANKYGVPRMCFVNKIDRMGADFYKCVGMIREMLGATPAVLQLPIGTQPTPPDSDFVGVIDLVENTAIIWSGEEMGAKFNVIPLADAPVDDALKAKAAEYRAELIELAVEQDEEALMMYLEGEEPDVATMKECIRKGTLSNSLVPVLTGTAFKNKGVQPLLDAVIDYMPAPDDVEAIQGTTLDGATQIERVSSDQEPFSALAFKIMTGGLHESPCAATVCTSQIPSSGRSLSAAFTPVSWSPGAKYITRSRASASVSAACFKCMLMIVLKSSLPARVTLSPWRVSSKLPLVKHYATATVL